MEYTLFMFISQLNVTECEKIIQIFSQNDINTKSRLKMKIKSKLSYDFQLLCAFIQLKVPFFLLLN